MTDPHTPPGSNDWAHFLKRGAVLGIIRVVGLVIVFLLQVALARLIADTEEYGKYAWGQSLLFMVGTLAAMGIPLATARFIASLSAQDKENAIVGVIRKAHRHLLLSSSVLVVIAALFLFMSHGEHNNMYLKLSAIALIAAPGVIFLLLYMHMSRARHWLLLAFLPFQVLRPLLTGIFAISAWWLLGQNLDGIQALVVVGLSLFTVLLPQSFIYRQRQTALLQQFGDSPSDSVDYHPGKLLRTSLPILKTRIATVSMEYSNVLLLGFLAGPAVAGAYFAAERLAQLSAVPSGIVTSLVQPDMAAAHARQDKRGVDTLSRRALLSGFWPTALIVLVLILMANPLLGLFGNEFTNARSALVILALGILVKTAAGHAMDLLLMTGKQNLVPRVMLITAAIHLLSLYILVPTLGAIGAALTSAFSGIISSVWLARLAIRELSINPTLLTGRPAT